MFEELVHKDLLQAGERCIPLLQKMHLILRQLDDQLHLSNWRRDSGAGGKSVATGNTWWLSTLSRPLICQHLLPVTALPVGRLAGCKIGQLLLLGADSAAQHETCWLLFFQGNADIWERLDLPLVYHRKAIPVLFSPAVTTSETVEWQLKTIACSLKCSSFWNPH